MTKLLLKLHEEQSSKWVHLCYLPEQLYKDYSEKKPQELADLNGTLARWAKEDFNQDIAVSTQEDLDTLKSLIKNYCKETYPDVYLEQSTDRQGWLRVWIGKKMREDLEIDGK